jgi:eukaryotic-like serine/threonine-protein kinase
MATDLTATSWRAFSTLLDRALELLPAERLAWVDTLGPEHAALKPALRAVLEHGAGVDTLQWLDTLPRSDGPAPPLDEPELQPDALVGPYRLIRELGVGGMGAVWLAERADGTLKRQVALKLPRATWTRGLAERMARERDILASLEHPNIARLYDAGTDSKGRPFLALEYVEGRPIDVYCRERALSIRQRLQLLLEVASAVTFAHTRLVIHRDLKPSNILVTADGQVRLLDFGIAKLMEGDRTQETQLTQVAGHALTLDYASPEQIRGEQIGTASDVYSLGVVAYELLTGARPYKLKRGSAAELEETIATVDAPLASASAIDTAARKELRGDLDAILNTALRKDAQQRYASVDAFAQDIERHLRGEPVLARPDRAGYRLRKFVGRNRLAVGAAAAVLLAVLTGATVALWQASVATRERDRALRLADRQESVLGFMNALVSDAARGGKPVTTEQLLKRTEAMVGSELKADPEAHAYLLSMMSTTMQTLGNSAEAIRLGEQALALLDPSSDPDVRDRILIAQALAIGWTGRYDEARGILERVLGRPDLPAIQRAEAHHYLGLLAATMNDGLGQVRHAEAALAALRSQRRPTGKLEVPILASLGNGYSVQGRMLDADTHMEMAYRRLEELGLEATAQGVTLLNNWAVVNLAAGDVRRAEQLAERALALAGPGERSAFLLLNRARALELRGRFVEAEAGYREAEQVAKDAKALPAVVSAKTWQASVFIERGELALAKSAIAQAEDAATRLPAGHRGRGSNLRVLTGRLALRTGDHSAARSAFEEVIAQAPENVIARLGLAELALLNGDAESALASAETAKAEAMRLQGGKPVSYRTGLASLMRARALDAAGRTTEARAEAAAAEAMLAAVDSNHPGLEQARAIAGR